MILRNIIDLRVVAFLFYIFINGTTGQTDWWKNTNKLHEELLVKRNYSASVNPQPAHNHSTVVYISMAARAISIDDVTQAFTLNAWGIMYWTDLRLKWDNKDFGQLKNTEFGQREVWKPDLLVYNNADPTDIQHYGNIPVIVYSSGLVLWVPPMTTKTECPMDLTYWPFDTQKCTIYLGSWTTHGLQIDFVPTNPNRTTEEFTESLIKTSHHWTINSFKLSRVSTTYACCPEPYITVVVEVDMTRTSPSFQSTVLIPAFAVGLLTLVQFVLPVDYPPRVTVGVASALLSLLMLINMAATLPPLGGSCPLIVQYYAMTLLLTVLSVALSGILARLAKEQPEVLSTPPPAIIKNILIGPLATFLCVRTIADKVGRSGAADKDGEEEVIGERKSFQHEWLLLAAAADRIAALIYVVVFIFGLIVFTSPLH